MRLSRRIWLPALVFVLLGLLGYFGPSYVLYNQLTSVPAHCQSEWMEIDRENTPQRFIAQERESVVDAEPYWMEEYEDVEFLARGEDVTIRAWLVRGESSEALILVHGLRACRQDSQVLLAAGMLAHSGYNLLMIDQRNHGESEVVDGRTAAGSVEFADALGAFDWLQEQGFESENIGIIGVSLGGAVAINAFGEEPELAALWVDSTFGDIHEIIQDELDRNNYPLFLTNGGLLVARMLGTNLTAHSPLESLAKNNDRPVFITHGTADTRVKVDYADDLYQQAGTNAELWIVDGTEHVEAMFRDPQEYEERITAFFDSALRE